MSNLDDGVVVDSVVGAVAVASVGEVRLVDGGLVDSSTSPALEDVVVVVVSSVSLSPEVSANPNMSLNSGLVSDSVVAWPESTASVTPNMSRKPSSVLSVEVDTVPVGLLSSSVVVTFVSPRATVGSVMSNISLNPGCVLAPLGVEVVNRSDAAESVTSNMSLKPA